MLNEPLYKDIKISFVGDILPANLPYTKGFGNYSNINKTEIIENVDKPDVFFANLESPLLLKNGIDSSFSGNPRIIEILKSVGINVVTISNNHILEQGQDGFWETIKLLRENDIKVVGINENNSSNIETFKIGDQTIAIAAFNAVHDIENPSLYAELNEAGIESALERMKHVNATFKILSFHWGNEYISLPNPDQIKTAHFAIEKGCDLIIGHHPHIVQKVEIINNKLVFYSLGNAYFDYLFTPNVMKGLRVDGIITKDNFKVDYHFISSKSLGFKKIKGDINLLLLSKQEIKRQNTIEYHDLFHKKHKRTRFRYRIKMKLYLLELFITLPVKNKIMLIKNIKQVFSSKFGGQSN